MPTKGVIVLAVAALAVVCLGALTITSQRTELLVGSYNARAMHGQAAPHPPRGIGKFKSIGVKKRSPWVRGLPADR